MLPNRAFLLVAAAWCASAAFGQGKDVVRVRKGGQIVDNAELVITQDDLKGVKAKNGPATMTFPASDIEEVVYGRAPEAFATARKKFQNDDYEEALTGFVDAAADEDDRKSYPWLVTYCLWYAAKCEEQLGNLQKAVVAYNDLVTKSPNSRFVPEAYSSLGALLLEADKKAEAKTYYERLAELTKKESLGAKYALRAELGLARIDGAANKLEEFAAKAAEFPELAGEAKLEVGRVAASRGDAAKAEQIFQTILKTAGVSERVFVGAANGLGDLQYDQKKYLDAAYTYSRAYAPFYGVADDPIIRSAAGWATFRGGKSADAYRAALPDTDPAKPLWNRRAKFLLRLAVQKYKETKGGLEAAKELGLQGT